MAEVASSAEREVELLCGYCLTVYPKGYHIRESEQNAVWMVAKYVERRSEYHFSAVGINLPATPDVDIILRGKWSTDRRYGRTFEVSSSEVVLPTSEAGFVQYILSLRAGIGKQRAKALFARFGDTVWNELENNPERMACQAGIPPEKIERLREKLRSSRTMRELLQLCRGTIEITPKKAASISATLGVDAVERIRENPYILCSVRGFGFRSVDKLAQKLGMSLESQERMDAMATFILDEEAARGNSCVPKSEFKKELTAEANRGFNSVTVSENSVRQALNEMWRKGSIVCTKTMLYGKARFEQESSIADNLHRLLCFPVAPIEHIPELISDYEKNTGMQLAKNQREAVTNAFRYQVSVITGGPGTGKTTILKAILFVHQKLLGKRAEPLLLSPTGRAARRMTESAGYPAQTIHSAVNYTGEDAEKEKENGQVLDANLIVVDESSMMDLYIASTLLKRIRTGTKVVFLGDPDQLPSVGCGNVLQDMIISHSIPMTKLDVIFRQSSESPIVGNAAKIRMGDTSLTYTDQFYLYREKSSLDVFRRACSLYYQSVKAFGIDNVILLNPYRDKSELSVNTFNLNLQHLLNPPAPGALEIEKDKGIHFRAGDRVMQMRNSEAARNGDVGYIKRIEVEHDEDDPNVSSLAAIVEFNGDGKEHIYTADMIRDLDLAYCTTIHKSQGSEYHTVIMIVSVQHAAMLRRNLVYTGITRAKKNIAIITEAELTQFDRRGHLYQKTAFDMAIENNKQETRYSLLSERLRAVMS